MDRPAKIPRNQSHVYTERASYMHCRVVDRIDDRWKQELCPDLSDTDGEMDIIDRVMECYQSCPKF